MQYKNYSPPNETSQLHIQEFENEIVITLVKPELWSPDEDEIECFAAIREWSKDQHLKMMKIHLDNFINLHQNPSYIEWISDLNPENVKNGIIDPRFLLSIQPQLTVWNKTLPKCYVTPIH